ncbi:hypothetical protein PIB30_083920 [Stylosanthes scabra]|uniref:Uncharacterized protein n=1 Tax=Stylosanthes scabra TaxID=79078 RepID=A0ABU6WQQ7_9FABA|nr:hypothetical protein [Stylosanthes scabra]
MEGVEGTITSLRMIGNDGYGRWYLGVQMERWNRVYAFELGIQESTLGTSESILKWTETKSHFQTSQRIDSSPSESTLLGVTTISTISKCHESTLKGSRVDSKLDRNDSSFETLQGADS